MRQLIFKALPYVKEEVTLALESGVDALIVPDSMAASAKSLARCVVLPESAVSRIVLRSKADEERAAALLAGRIEGEKPALVVLALGWEIIPVENLLAESSELAVEVGGLAEAELAVGVLERGVTRLVITPEALPEIRAIAEACKYSPGPVALSAAVITRISQAGMGHRVCVDTTSLMRAGQGMLVGNSAAFTFLINAESEHNEYVAARPFRVNAGGVHAYAIMPGDRTAYLEELAAGSEALIVDSQGKSHVVTVGRVKVERRPMLLIEAEARDKNAPQDRPASGGVFVQNAETIRLVTPAGRPVSVVDLKEGDAVLCRLDEAGRHFGMRISEDIKEG
ncbi:MAG: 3-dehydroquinate synthase II family protein [Desulfovibrio sp.]|jgi:3-dehydroquinate synthase II|nr:3-dehydroquinate synthase II family protein [Desulfovibrio sp.]